MAIEQERLAACPVCGEGQFEAVLDVPDFESQTGTYSIVRCKACDVGFTNPRPTPASLPQLYAARTTADFPDPQAGLGHWLRRGVIDRYVQTHLPCSPGPHVADYGCGDGALCLGLLRVRNDLRVDAIDFHVEMPPTLRGKERVRYFDHAAWEGIEDRYDMIFLRHVLEHHPTPVQMLQQLRGRLRPGGRLVLEVPNRHSVWASWLGRYWFAWYVPRHLIHFSRESLAFAAQAAGLRQERLGLRHTPVIGGSLGYRLGRPIGNLGLLGLVSYPIQWLVDVVAGTSTTLEAVLVRDA